ncbi:MAG: fibronectin type III-like domain-contianing protein [Candidatus Hodarchaeales archaeon]
MTITNTGDRSASEVIQVYYHPLESSIDRPPKELIGFEKIRFSPNETKKVGISINSKDLAYYDVPSGLWKIENGNYKLMVGSSSRDIHLECDFEYYS